MLSFVTIASLMAVATAVPYGYGSAIATIGSVSNPNYGFNYAVSDPHTGDNKAQSEVREGGVVKGSYSLNEADGTVRVVDYHADPVTGFNAVVKRLGQAVHPQPILHAPIAHAAQIVTPAIGLSYGLGNGLVVNGYGLAANGYGLAANGLALGKGLGLSGYGLGGLALDGHLGGLAGYGLEGIAGHGWGH